MKIIWSDQALFSYEEIIDSILERWPVEFAEEFERLTNELLDNLKAHNKLCPPSRRKKLRRCVIHENASLIYKLNKEAIELVTFIDNRKDHKY